MCGLPWIENNFPNIVAGTDVDDVIPDDIKINDQVLQHVEQTKLLGVWLTENLKSDLHFEKLFRKCVSGMAILRKLSRFGFPSDALWNFYSSFVFSNVTYAWPVICDLPNAKIRKLITIEKQAMRICAIQRPIDLESRLESICINLMRKVKYNHNHPLRKLFNERSNAQYNIRNTFSLMPMFSKSSRLNKTFVKYYKHS